MGTIPAATAAAEPPDEPPGTRRTSIGFRTGPYALFSVEDPIANSSMFVFATMIAPSSRRRVIAVASYGLVYPARIFDAHVVGRSSVQMLSFTAIGTPASWPPFAAPDSCVERVSASASATFSSDHRMELRPSGPEFTPRARAKLARRMSAGDVVPSLI